MSKIISHLMNIHRRWKPEISCLDFFFQAKFFDYQIKNQFISDQSFFRQVIGYLIKTLTGTDDKDFWRLVGFVDRKRAFFVE